MGGFYPPAISTAMSSKNSYGQGALNSRSLSHQNRDLRNRDYITIENGGSNMYKKKKKKKFPVSDAHKCLTC